MFYKQEYSNLKPFFLRCKIKTSSQNNNFLNSRNDENEKPKFQKLTLANVVGLLLASMGWLYYLVVVVTYWNFVSYLMLTGLILVGPSTFMILLQQPKSVKRDQLFLRRLTLAGWFLGGLTIGLFPNVSLMPSQIQRHLNPSLYLLQPVKPF